ncbi:MAG: FAD-binding oxidoreductase [Rhizomicrobium sp.]
MAERWDVAIVGAGVSGGSTAYHLMASAGRGLRVLILDPDPSYEFAASARSAGSIRQQFSMALNVRMAAYNFAFLQEAGERLAIDGEKADIQFRHGSYLFLADTDAALGLAAAYDIQKSAGADVELLSPAGLAREFPWLDTADIALASIGRGGEGWFDGYAFAQALRRKAISFGAQFRKDAVEAILIAGGRVAGLRAGGAEIAADKVVCAAGTHGPGLLRSLGVDVPVYPRKRSIFYVRTPFAMDRNIMLIDTSGVYLRPEGRGYICGVGPRLDPDVALTDFAVDHGLFEDVIWPVLAGRIPQMEQLRVEGAWSGHYDLNIFDHNAIVGAVGEVEGLFLATGFSGHGLQQSPSVGRGLAELILNGRYTSLDLSPLGLERLASPARVEHAIV